MSRGGGGRSWQRGEWHETNKYNLWKMAEDDVVDYIDQGQEDAVNEIHQLHDIDYYEDNIMPTKLNRPTIRSLQHDTEGYFTSEDKQLEERELQLFSQSIQAAIADSLKESKKDLSIIDDDINYSICEDFAKEDFALVGTTSIIEDGSYSICEDLGVASQTQNNSDNSSFAIVEDSSSSSASSEVGFTVVNDDPTPTCLKDEDFDVIDADVGSTPFAPSDWELIKDDSLFKNESDEDFSSVDFDENLPANAKSDRGNEYTKEELDCDSKAVTIPVCPPPPLSSSRRPTTCAICLEVTPTMELLSKCRHPRACFKCLQTHYVDYQMHSLENYPLRCFWPGCKGYLRDVHMRRLTHSNSAAMELFFDTESQAKGRRKSEMKEKIELAKQKRLEKQRIYNFLTLVDCLFCTEKPIPVYPTRPEFAINFVCGSCHQVNPRTERVLSHKEVESVVKAAGDALVNCPECSMLIIKSGGCNHMTCVCGFEFSFMDAKKSMDKGASVSPNWKWNPFN